MLKIINDEYNVNFIFSMPPPLTRKHQARVEQWADFEVQASNLNSSLCYKSALLPTLPVCLT